MLGKGESMNTCNTSFLLQGSLSAPDVHIGPCSSSEGQGLFLSFKVVRLVLAAQPSRPVALALPTALSIPSVLAL